MHTLSVRAATSAHQGSRCLLKKLSKKASGQHADSRLRMKMVGATCFLASSASKTFYVSMSSFLEDNLAQNHRRVGTRTRFDLLTHSKERPVLVISPSCVCTPPEIA